MRAAVSVLVGVAVAFAICWPAELWPLFLSGVALLDA